jgi:alkanesulfonate monooxygenase SsuD/methylene tetrahydromethanopterin reductase-like flavin-dependent oxidoreductase (luciferase family)
VHDIVNLESLGIPSVFVASSEFVDAAASQARSLGADPAVVFVQHPIQDRTDDEMRALADGAVDALLAHLTAASGRA